MEKQKRILIAAIDNNCALGYEGHLLYKLPGDLQHFKRLTQGNVVVMGRKTYESLAKPLPRRVNVVISRTQLFEGVVVRNSLDAALEYAMTCHADKDIFLIGGATVYGEAMSRDLVDEMYLTHIDATSRNYDAVFPFLNLKREWELLDETHMSDDGIEYTISHYARM